ncbi:RING-H2 finger protein ATL34-like [Hordeum vulgare subsp. vulgare]|uniref:RING-type E3 ubiquitin transferase n=1 Tax=Hordeum vulgare subsp. vulgare TaxID=112509 RepID=A0A8I7BES1_HORVV|nr:RING-H2 finger protein ATL34-like [Hordeum vulgare subsp. vulgare]
MSQPQDRIIAGIFIGIVASLLVSIIVCSLCRGHRNSRAPRPLSERSTVITTVRVDQRQLRQACAASPTAGLPAFTYSLSVKHNVTGGGEEAATCSVCLGAFHLGETVRLLPACLHLYHAECIDPWLDAHSTCPICRSDTDPATGVGRLPPAA